jgi:Glycosyltransferase family 6
VDKNLKIALLIIATGEVYWDYAKSLIASARKFFPRHDAILFTDCPNDLGADLEYIIPYAGFPDATMMRYHTILKAKEILRNYDFLYYADADCLFVTTVEEGEIFTTGLLATLHPGYVGQGGPTEKNPKSACYLINNKSYFCGGFDGGTSTEYLKMAEAIKDMIDYDLALGIIPVWHDESAKNKYLANYVPYKILSPSFCYPENASSYYTRIWDKGGYKNVTPKLLALTKHGVKR